MKTSNQLDRYQGFKTCNQLVLLDLFVIVTMLKQYMAKKAGFSQRLEKDAVPRGIFGKKDTVSRSIWIKNITVSYTNWSKKRQSFAAASG